MNPIIKEHNDKVEQLHELIDWFEEEYKNWDEDSSKVAQELKDISLRIGKLVDK